MLGNCKPVGFIPVSDFDRARAFFGGVLGLQIVSQDDFALVALSGGISIRIVKAPPFTPHPFTLFGWEVSGIATVVDGLAARGVVFEHYPFFGDAQGPDGIWTTPGGDKVAWFKDPDGNLLSVSEHAA